MIIAHLSFPNEAAQCLLIKAASMRPLQYASLSAMSFKMLDTCHICSTDLEKLSQAYYFLCFVALRSTSIYDHGGTVNSLNHTFPGQSVLRVHTFTCNWQQPSSWMIQRKDDRRNHFIINLHESIGSGQDWTRDPWICSQTRICLSYYATLKLARIQKVLPMGANFF